ncbi:oxidoreductase domain protein [Chthoniobacter flavus Ellin428]|uniref:Oxidoreductase domain protein n=1 Tax=Chthoniobacter flavus Ellin428 TaxID=497964 RepID=B4CX25_9BACT|nr:Gfo/Idh/MocA family oxidoreductase [Chthoniobacter flavus]EDY21345.1 oxidoreductase domain protein [Chthoniobacter flavus Ellin428]TCO84886.1 putative dehydrogenase [Chthoniobacter flavus]
MQSPSRRQFLQQTSLALAATAALPLASRAATNITSDRLRIGIIGCGARGSGAVAQALTADSNTELFAMGDVFPEQIEKSIGVIGAQFKDKPGRVNVAEERKFVGLDAYQKVLASGVDLVVLSTPGGFRPMLLDAAVKAGKHIFCEKPMGIDPTGVRSVRESVKLAKEKKLALRAGFNMRFEPAYREAMQRIHDGQIGDIVAIYSTRMANRLTRFSGERKPGEGDLEWQLRNWHHFVWLSGDWIMEVSVHSVDKIAWAMRDVPPVRCVASGARQQQTLGNVWDQFDITYEWENGTIAVLKTRYQDGCYNDHSDVIIGTKGRCFFNGYKAHITGENPWRYQGPTVASHQIEHDELFADIRAGKIPNDGDRMAQSTLMGIMGRMSAYTGKEVTWQQALDSKLETMPKNLAWDMKLEVPPPAVAGHTPLV